MTPLSTLVRFITLVYHHFVILRATLSDSKNAILAVLQGAKHKRYYEFGAEEECLKRLNLGDVSSRLR